MVDLILQPFVRTSDPLFHDKLVLLLDWSVRNSVLCSDQMNIALCSIHLYFTYSLAEVLPDIYKSTLAKQYIKVLYHGKDRKEEICVLPIDNALLQILN